MLKKNVVSGLMIATVFFLSSFNATAADINSSLEEKMKPGINNEQEIVRQFFNSQESQNAIARIQENFVESYGKEEDNVQMYQGLSFMPEKAYKIHELKSENVIQEFDKEGRLGSNISEECIFNVPISNSKNEMVGNSIFYKEGNNYELVSYEKMDEKQKVLTSTTALSSLLNKQNTVKAKSDVQDAKTFVMYKYNTYAIYVCTEEDEYVIPISTNSLLTQLEENKTYTANEFVDVLRLNSQEGVIQQSEDPTEWIVGGGTGVPESKDKIAATMVLGISIVGLLTTIFIMKKRM